MRPRRMLRSLFLALILGAIPGCGGDGAAETPPAEDPAQPEPVPPAPTPPTPTPPNPGPSWSILRDFNSGPVNTPAVRTGDGFDHTSAAVYSNEQTRDGLSAKTHIKQGTNGFGIWGGYIDFPTTVKKGETLWLEIYIYVPGFFQIDSGTGSLKFLRFYGRHQDGSNGGALDIQIVDDNQSFAEFRMLREKQFVWYSFGQDGDLVRDTWHRVNVEFRVDDLPQSQGGTSYVKFWLNQRLLADVDSIQTLIQPADELVTFLLFTYYNSTSPIDQHVWVDDISISNQRPAWRDEMGN